MLYKLDFDRAWATVGSALDVARLEVEDLDRSAQTYFVYYSEVDEREPGFLGRFFSDDEEQERLGSRYQVRLDDRPDAVQVSILNSDSTPADALIAERLLKIIKESST
ncbi:MAG: outer membrane protein assembly factor BamC [Pseudomonadales bacterium]